MTSLTLARRRPAALAAVVASGTLLSGCSFWAPNTAIQPYAPADGLQAELGEVIVANVLVVSEGDGEPGLLVGALVNRSDEDILVALEVGGTSEEILLPAQFSVALGIEGDRPDEEASRILTETVVVDEVDVPAGGVVPLAVRAPAGGTLLEVPVYPPTGPYDGLLPGDAVDEDLGEREDVVGEPAEEDPDETDLEVAEPEDPEEQG